MSTGKCGRIRDVQRTVQSHCPPSYCFWAPADRAASRPAAAHAVPLNPNISPQSSQSKPGSVDRGSDHGWKS